VAIKGTAGLWSTKVLRAGMGAHFGLQLIESASAENLLSLKMPLLGTDVHEGPYLHELLKQGGLTQKCAWVMGHEGQGVSAEIMALVTQKNQNFSTRRRGIFECGHGCGHLPSRQCHLNVKGRPLKKSVTCVSVKLRVTAIMRGFPASTCTHPLTTSHFPSKAAKKTAF